MAGKVAQARAAFGPVRGYPPSIEQRAVGELQVDPTYQRSVDGKDSQAAIRRIAETWDWRLCAPLTVSRRPGSGSPAFFVIDGQHRLEAARLRGDIAHLPCIVSTFETLADEAACFVGVNTRRRAISPVDTFRAAIAAGDARALAIGAAIREAGLAVARSTNFTIWKPGEIAAVQGVGLALNRYEPDKTQLALTAVARAWPDEVLRYSGSILRGLYPFVASTPNVQVERLSTVLGARRQVDWYSAMLTRQARHGETPESAMQYAIADAFAKAKS